VTLLEEFIFALNKTERAKLRPLQFRGAKRTIFFKILNCRDPEGINQEHILKSLKLTKKRFYQMLGEMLHACYVDVAPVGNTELLQYLGNIQLYRHFFHEMKRLETILIEKNDRMQLEDFYFKVLLMSEFFLIPPHLAGNLRSEFQKYSLRYAEIKTPHPCDACFIRCGRIEEDINNNFSRNFSLEKLRISIDELERLFGCIKEHDHALAKFKISYLLAMTYFGNFFKDKKPDIYLKYINTIVDEHPEVFGSVAELIKLGVQSYLPPQKEDLEQYKEYLLHPASTGEGSSLLFIERFLPLIVKHGEIEWAKKFISVRFPINPDQLRKETALHWWRLLLIYYINADNYTEAEICVQKALSANTGKTRMTDLDINLRCYSIFITIMQHGPDLVGDLVSRHIRYARRHGYNKGEGFMMTFLKAVHDLISRPAFDKEHSMRIRNQYLTDLGSEERLYILFEKIYSRYFA
jgi:hypothetical protein